MITKLKIFIRRIIKKDLVKVFSLNGVSTVIKMIIGILNAKIIAVLIGPSGIALIGQLQDFKRLYITFANGGISQGVTKYIAEYKNSENKTKLIISNALVITLFMSVSMALLLLIFSKHFAEIVLMNLEYRIVFIILGISIIFFAVNRFLLSIINGFKDFYIYIKINILSSFFSLLFTLTLVFFWNIKGALIAQVTFESVVLFITVLMIKKRSWFKFSYFFFQINKNEIFKLLKYGLMMAVPVIIAPIVMIMIRKDITSKISLDAAGYWTGVMKISGYITNVITQSLSVYILPRYSELINKKDIIKEIKNTYKLVIPILLVSFCCIFIFKKIIITMLFSKEFLPMADLMLAQFSGDFIRMITWVISMLLISKAMIKVFVFSELFFNLLYLFLAQSLIEYFSIMGVMYAGVINSFIYFIFIIIIFMRKLNSDRVVF